MGSPIRFVGRIASLLALILAALAVPVTAGAQGDQTCQPFPETNQEICGVFLIYWENNGGLPVFGYPSTVEFQELNADTLVEYDTQYYERERFEYHPENEGTPYVILLGRLGVSILEAEGIDWTQFPKANPSDPHYMEATGHAIAPEFWGYWSNHGLDLGDEGVSFRESLALFGYPISPPQVETNADGDTVLTQWFERGRFEHHPGNTPEHQVLLGRLGAEFLASDADFSIRVETELNAAMLLAFNTYETPGVIAGLWVDGVGLWSGAVGEADWDSGAPYTEDTYQRVGSVTKTFTATIILQLVDAGLLSLDDTLDGWFPEVPNSDQITLRMMLNMTSGVSDYSQSQAWQEAYFSDTALAFMPAQLVEYIIPLTPSFAPGTGWEYSNSNYVLLGLIIEAITGQPFHEALHERILDPISLLETVFPATEDTDLPDPFARGLTEQGFTDDVKESTFWNTSWTFSAGELMATLEDLLVWGRVLGTGELLSAETQAERLDWVTTPPLSDELRYGLGILYLSGWIGHDGIVPGYTTWVLYQPELDAVLVVMANTDITNADGIDPSLGTLIELLAVANRTSPPLYD